jgi:phosphohistidine phosphatase
MRRLILLRHAKAYTPAGASDHERPLAPRGQRQAEVIGRYMAEHDLIPDLAIVSTALRAQETWKLALASFGRPVPVHSERRLYEATTSELLAVVNEADDAAKTLLMVGHNPGFERLTAYLAGQGEATAATRLQREFPTAGLAVIDFSAVHWRDIGEAAGYLERFETVATIG